MSQTAAPQWRVVDLDPSRLRADGGFMVGQSEGTWGDVSRRVGLGVNDIISGAAGVAERVTGYGAGVRRWAAGEEERFLNEMTPAGRRQTEASWEDVSWGEAPGWIAGQVTRSLPGMLATGGAGALAGGVARGVAIGGFNAGARAAGVTSGVAGAGGASVGGLALGSGTTRSDVANQIEGMDANALQAQSPLYRELRAGGLSHEDARARVAQVSGDRAFDVAAPSSALEGVVDYVLTRGVGRAMRGLRPGGVERLAAGAVTGETAGIGRRMAVGAVRGAALESGTEFVQSGMEDIAVQQGLRTMRDPNAEGWFEGVDWDRAQRAAVSGAVVGAAMGGTFGAASRIRRNTGVDPANQAALQSSTPPGPQGGQPPGAPGATGAPGAPSPIPAPSGMPLAPAPGVAPGAAQGALPAPGAAQPPADPGVPPGLFQVTPPAAPGVAPSTMPSIPEAQANPFGSMARMAGFKRPQIISTARSLSDALGAETDPDRRVFAVDNVLGAMGEGGLPGGDPQVSPLATALRMAVMEGTKLGPADFQVALTRYRTAAEALQAGRPGDAVTEFSALLEKLSPTFGQMDPDSRRQALGSLLEQTNGDMADALVSELGYQADQARDPGVNYEDEMRATEIAQAYPPGSEVFQGPAQESNRLFEAWRGRLESLRAAAERQRSPEAMREAGIALPEPAPVQPLSPRDRYRAARSKARREKRFNRLKGVPSGGPEGRRRAIAAEAEREQRAQAARAEEAAGVEAESRTERGTSYDLGVAVFRRALRFKAPVSLRMLVLGGTELIARQAKADTGVTVSPANRRRIAAALFDAFKRYRMERNEPVPTDNSAGTFKVEAREFINFFRALANERKIVDRSPDAGVVDVEDSRETIDRVVGNRASRSVLATVLSTRNGIYRLADALDNLGRRVFRTRLFSGDTEAVRASSAGSIMRSLRDSMTTPDLTTVESQARRTLSRLLGRGTPLNTPQRNALLAALRRVVAEARKINTYRVAVESGRAVSGAPETESGSLRANEIDRRGRSIDQVLADTENLLDLAQPRTGTASAVDTQRVVRSIINALPALHGAATGAQIGERVSIGDLMAQLLSKAQPTQSSGVQVAAVLNQFGNLLPDKAYATEKAPLRAGYEDVFRDRQIGTSTEKSEREAMKNLRDKRLAARDLFAAADAAGDQTGKPLPAVRLPSKRVYEQWLIDRGIKPNITGRAPEAVESLPPVRLAQPALQYPGPVPLNSRADILDADGNVVASGRVRGYSRDGRFVSVLRDSAMSQRSGTMPTVFDLRRRKIEPAKAGAPAAVDAGRVAELVAQAREASAREAAQRAEAARTRPTLRTQGGLFDAIQSDEMKRLVSPLVDAQHARETAPSVENIVNLYDGFHVYNGGDVHLVYGLGAAGRAVYMPVLADGRYYSMDVRDLTNPADLNAEQFARLKKVAVMMDNVHRTEAADAMSEIFAKDTVVRTSAISGKMADFTRAVLARLGLADSRVMILSTQETRRGAAGELKLRGHTFSYASGVGKDSFGRLISRYDTPNVFSITLDTRLTEEEQLHVLAHEIGHLVQRTALEGAPPATVAALKAAHRDYLNRNRGKSIRAVVRDRMTNQTARLIEATASDVGLDSMFSEGSDAYNASFGEWFADNVARWMTSDARPIGVVEKFFAQIGRAYRFLMEAIGINVPAKNVLADPAVARFMSGLWAAPVAPTPNFRPGQQLSMFDQRAMPDPVVEDELAPLGPYLRGKGDAGRSWLSDIGDKMLRVFRIEDLADLYDPAINKAVGRPVNLIASVREALERQGSVKRDKESPYQSMVDTLDQFQRGNPQEHATLSTLVHNSTINNYDLSRPTLADSPLPANMKLTPAEVQVREAAWNRDKAAFNQTSVGAQVIYKAIGGLGSDTAANFQRSLLQNILYNDSEVRKQAATQANIDFTDPKDIRRFQGLMEQEATSILNGTPTRYANLSVQPRLSRLVQEFVTGFPVSNYYFPERRYGDYVAALTMDIDMMKVPQAVRDQLVNALSNRFGRIEVMGDTKKGDLKLRLRHTSFHENSAAAQHARDQLSSLASTVEQEVQALLPASVNPTIETKVGEVRAARNEPWRANTEAISDRSITELRDEALKDAAARGLTTQAAEAYANSFADMLYDWKYRHSPESNFFKSLITRDGVLGAEPNLARALASYSQGVGNLLGRLEHSGVVDDLMRLVDNAANQKATGADAKRLSSVYNTLNDRVRDSREIDQTSGIVRSAMNLGYTWFLLSPAYWMQNMLQNFTMTLPILTARYGSKSLSTLHAAQGHTLSLREFGKAFGTMASVAREIVSSGKKLSDAEVQQLLATVPDSIGHITDAVDKSSRYKAVRTSTGATLDLRDDLKRMLGEALERGKIDLTFGMSLAEMANDGKRGVLDKLSEITRSVPQQIEVFNRASTAMAAYELARREGKTHAQATTEALQMVDRSQVDYSSMNRPGWPNLQRYPSLRVVAMFKQYALAMYMLGLKSLLTVSREGVRTPAGREALGLMMGITATHALLGGAMGIMLAEPIKAALLVTGLLTGVDNDDAERWLRNQLAGAIGRDAEEAFSKGIPRLLGFDLSTRITPPTLLLSDQALRGSPNERPSDAFSRFIGQLALGPLGSIPGNAMNSYRSFAEGDVMRGFEGLLPAMGRNFVRAARFGSEGIMDTNGQVLRSADRMGPADLAFQALGLTPAQAAGLYERREAARQVTTEVSGRRASLMESYWRAPPAERAAVRQEIADFNRRYPGSKIDQRDIQQSMRARMRRQQDTQAGDGVYTPRTQRGLVQEEVRFGR